MGLLSVPQFPHDPNRKRCFWQHPPPLHSRVRVAIPGTALTQVVPDVHLPAQRPHLDDGLAQEVVGLPLEALLDAGLDVVILIPDTDFDAVGGVMALTAGRGEWEPG